MRGKFFNRFIVDANIITYVDGQEDSSCMLMGCQSLMRVPSFCIWIVHSSNNYISVGVVDQNYQIYKDCWER